MRDIIANKISFLRQYYLDQVYGFSMKTCILSAIGTP